MVRKRLFCSRCTESLFSGGGQFPQSVGLKDKGGLPKPSRGVLAVCGETEKCIEKYLRDTDDQLPQGPRVSSEIATSVLEAVRGKVFSSLDDHVFDTAVEEDHVHLLVKTISLCFSEVRFHHLAEERRTDKSYRSEDRETRLQAYLVTVQTPAETVRPRSESRESVCSGPRSERD